MAKHCKNQNYNKESMQICMKNDYSFYMREYGPMNIITDVLR